MRRLRIINWKENSVCCLCSCGRGKRDNFSPKRLLKSNTKLITNFESVAWQTEGVVDKAAFVYAFLKYWCGYSQVPSVCGLAEERSGKVAN